MLLPGALKPQMLINSHIKECIEAHAPTLTTRVNILPHGNKVKWVLHTRAKPRCAPWKPAGPPLGWAASALGQFPASQPALLTEALCPQRLGPSFQSPSFFLPVLLSFLPLLSCFLKPTLFSLQAPPLSPPQAHAYLSLSCSGMTAR